MDKPSKPTMSLETEQRAEWVEFIEHTLMGTCNSIEGDADHAHLLDDPEFCKLLDSMIFNCETCNWWCENSEMGNDGVQHGICRECCMDNDIEMDDD